jgi:biotin synthase-like enzyme
MIREGRIAELVKDGSDLFTEATMRAHKKDLVLSAPIVLIRGCNITPLCRHCSWRAPSKLMIKYASTKTSIDEAVSRSVFIEKSGVGSVYLVSGWMKNALPDFFFSCVENIRKNTKLEIIANFGAITRTDIIKLKEAGVDTINCALETTNIKVFNSLKPGDSYEARFKTLVDAKKLGFKTSTNFIIGIGESLEDIDNSIRVADELDIDSLSVSCIQPTPFTETEDWDRPKPYMLGRIGAAARICLTRNIDIGMHFDATMDLAWGMRCGANAFNLALRNSGETPELLGDDISRATVMWKDYGNPDIK